MKHFLLVVPCLFTAFAAHADVIYTTPGPYNAATNTIDTITFDGIAPNKGRAPNKSYVVEPNPFTLQGRRFTESSAGSFAYIINPVYYGSSYPGGGFLNVDYAKNSVNTLTVTLPSVTAVSFNYGGLFGPISLPIMLSDGFTTTLITGDSITGTNSLGFAGITSTVPLTSITFDLPDAADYDAIDNFSWGNVRPAPPPPKTPEPSTLTLLSTGLVGLSGLVRRKLRR